MSSVESSCTKVLPTCKIRTISCNKAKQFLDMRHHTYFPYIYINDLENDMPRVFSRYLIDSNRDVLSSLFFFSQVVSLLSPHFPILAFISQIFLKSARFIDNGTKHHDA